AALLCLATWTGPGQEAYCVEYVRSVRKCAQPHEDIIAFGDKLLGRGGALIAAVEKSNPKYDTAVPVGWFYNGRMAIDGSPQRSLHGFCFYCHQWCNLSEGVRLIPQATGPLTGLRAYGAAITGDKSALKFACNRCLRRRRIWRRALLAILLGLIATV